MKKTALALAIASAMGVSSSAYAVDFNIDDKTEFSVYGNIQLKFITQDNADGESESALDDNGSTIGFSGEHKFTEGLAGFFKAEFEHRADEEKGAGGLNKGDQAYLGLKGPFGAIRVGSWDSLYQDAIYDEVDPFETASVSQEADSAEGDTIAWFSPKFADQFQVQLGARVRGDGDTGADSTEVGWSAVGKWTPGNFAVHVGYDDRGGNDSTDANGNTVFDEGSTVGVVALYDFGALTLGARYANSSDFTDTNDTDFIAGLAQYDYSRGSIYGVVQRVDPEGGDSRTEFAAGVSWLFPGSDNFYVYTEFGMYDQVNDEDDLFEVGAIYEF